MNFTHAPFGAEYGLAPRWPRWHGWYVRTLGMVDLPSRIRARQVLAEATAGTANQVLDFGCGAGSYAYFFSRDPRVSVMGFDVDAARLEQCSAVSQALQRPQLEFVHESEVAFWQRLGDRRFDLILAVEVLAYVADLESTLTNMYARLRPGGRLVGHVELPEQAGTWDKRDLGPCSLSGSLRRAGFEVIEMRHSFTRLHHCLIGFAQSQQKRPMWGAFSYPFLLAAAVSLGRFGSPTTGLLFHATRNQSA